MYNKNEYVNKKNQNVNNKKIRMRKWIRRKQEWGSY